MSGTNSLHSGLTRRNFLKTTAAVAGATATIGAAAPLAALAEDYKQGQIVGEDEKIYQGVCRPNCFAYCPLNIHVRNGNIVKVSRGEHVDPYYNRACLRGLSHVLRTYNPDRIKYPMRRVEGTERGSNQWERISWDEAISEIAEKFSYYREEFGDQAVSAFRCSGNMSALHGSMPGISTLFINTLNMSSCGNEQDMALFHGINRVVGAAGFFVRNEAKDFVNSKVIFSWGDNMTSATIHEWHSVAEAVENGTKLIVIDPIYTEAASKAHIWVPIRPGSDTALILSMMNVIFSEQGENEDYLRQHTVAPYLIDPDTHMFLRMSAFGVEPTEGSIDAMTGQPTMIDPVVVWDLNAAKAVSETTVGINPAITGTFEIEGKKYRTALDYLIDEVNQYPPEVAAELTDVPAETIVELAHYAMDTPVMHRMGYGSQAYGNGVHPGHAMATLCGILGNLGYEGAGFGSASNMYPGLNYAYCMPTGPATSPAIPTFVFREVMRTGKYRGEDFPVKAMMFYTGNPVCCGVQTNEFIEDVINNLEFIVTLDQVFTDTARYSDIVLPVAGWFEQEDVTVMGQTYYLEYTEKAIDPLYESKPDGDIFRLLADKMGIGQYFQMTDEEFINGVFDSDYSKLIGGVTLERLRKERAVFYYPKHPYIAWEGNLFNTPSGRLEFYVEDPAPRVDMGQEIDKDRERLPRFFPPIEAWPENPTYEKYPLVLVSERSKFQVHSQWFSTPWLKELDSEPRVKINPEDAKSRGIEDNSYVRVYNDRGHAVAKVNYSEGIKPGMLCYPKSWQMHQHKSGCWSELLSSAFDPVGVNSNFMDCLCEIEPWDEGE